MKEVDAAFQAEIGESDTVTQPAMDLSHTEPDQTRPLQPRMKPMNLRMRRWELLLQ